MNPSKYMNMISRTRMKSEAYSKPRSIIGYRNRGIISPPNLPQNEENPQILAFIGDGYNTTEWVELNPNLDYINPLQAI